MKLKFITACFVLFILLLMPAQFETFKEQVRESCRPGMLISKTIKSSQSAKETVKVKTDCEPGKDQNSLQKQLHYALQYNCMNPKISDFYTIIQTDRQIIAEVKPEFKDDKNVELKSQLWVLNQDGTVLCTESQIIKEGMLYEFIINIRVEMDVFGNYSSHVQHTETKSLTQSDSFVSVIRAKVE